MMRNFVQGMSSDPPGQMTMRFAITLAVLFAVSLPLAAGLMDAFSLAASGVLPEILGGDGLSPIGVNPRLGREVGTRLASGPADADTRSRR